MKILIFFLITYLNIIIAYAQAPGAYKHDFSKDYERLYQNEKADREARRIRIYDLERNYNKMINAAKYDDSYEKLLENGWTKAIVSNDYNWADNIWVYIENRKITKSKYNGKEDIIYRGGKIIDYKSVIFSGDNPFTIYIGLWYD
jgi:hypothetical protein